MRSHDDDDASDSSMESVYHLDALKADRYKYPDRPPEPNSYRKEIINMIKFQESDTQLPQPLPRDSVMDDTNLDSNGNRRSSWDAERSILVERGHNNGGGGGGGGIHHATTPWISEFHVRGMQRSAVVDQSELTNILKLELFNPPSKANESRAQRQRRLRAQSSDEEGSTARRQPMNEPANSDEEDSNVALSSVPKSKIRYGTESNYGTVPNSKSHNKEEDGTAAQRQPMYEPANEMQSNAEHDGCDDKEGPSALRQPRPDSNLIQMYAYAHSSDRKTASTKAIIDSGATKSVVNNVNLIAYGTYKLLFSGAVAIKGICGDAELFMTGEGSLSGPFEGIQALHNAEVTANVISFRDLLKLYRVSIIDQDTPVETLHCVSRLNPTLPAISIPVDPVTGYWVYDSKATVRYRYRVEPRYGMHTGTGLRRGGLLQ